MNHFLNNIQKNLLWWIFGAVAVGLLNVKLFGGIGFSSLICLLAAFIMIYPSLVAPGIGVPSASLLKRLFRSVNFLQ